MGGLEAPIIGVECCCCCKGDRRLWSMSELDGALLGRAVTGGANSADLKL